MLSVLRLYNQIYCSFFFFSFFLLKKLEKSFSHFSNKSIGIFQILAFEILTKGELRTSLILNNRAQVVNMSDARKNTPEKKKVIAHNIEQNLVHTVETHISFLLVLMSQLCYHFVFPSCSHVNSWTECNK